MLYNTIVARFFLFVFLIQKREVLFWYLH